MKARNGGHDQEVSRNTDDDVKEVIRIDLSSIACGLDMDQFKQEFNHRYTELQKL